MPHKKTDLLWVGCSEASWKEQAGATKALLARNRDEKWQFGSTCRTSFKAAAEWVSIRKELEVVVVTNEYLSQDYLAQGCLDLAKALHGHPNRPWVTFATADLEYLEDVFAKAGVRVEIGDIEWVIAQRWASRVPAAA